MTKDELRAECVKAANPPIGGFAATAIKISAARMGLLPAEAERAYEAGIDFATKGQHADAFKQYQRMAALILAAMGR